MKRYPSYRGQHAKTLALRQAQDEGFGFLIGAQDEGDSLDLSPSVPGDDKLRVRAVLATKNEP